MAGLSANFDLFSANFDHFLANFSAPVLVDCRLKSYLENETFFVECRNLESFYRQTMLSSVNQTFRRRTFFEIDKCFVLFLGYEICNCIFN